MIYVRGIPQDVSDWNVTGWTWPRVLEWYKKSEQNTGDTTKLDSVHHSTTGPMQISDARYRDYASQMFVQSAISAGYPRNNDFNGATREGAGYYQFNNRDGMRDSTARSHLAPHIGKPNLKIITNATVTRLLFTKDGDKYRVDGVEYLTNEKAANVKSVDDLAEQVTTLRATKEVIVTAGAINSPKLLLLSGIGPQTDLQALKLKKVETYVDIPGVGKNLHDHPLTWVDWYYPNAYYPNAYAISKHLDAYAWARNGIFSWSGLGGGAFVKTHPSKDRPDVQFTVFPKDLESSLEQDVIAPPSPQRAAMTASVTLDTPKYRGSLRLKNNNPLDPPLLIDTLEQLFKESRNPKEDMDSLVQGILILRKIKNSYPMNVTLGEEMTPGAHINSTEALENWVRSKIKRTYV